MTFREYQRAVMRTANKDHRRKEAIEQAAWGIAGESGEVLDRVKKWFAQGRELDKEKLAEELGDVLWYCARGWVELEQRFRLDTDFIKIDLRSYTDMEGVPLKELTRELFKNGSRILGVYDLSEGELPGKIFRQMVLIAAISRRIGSNIEEVAERNIQKLKERYPEGFSVEHSVNRGE